MELIKVYMELIMYNSNPFYYLMMIASSSCPLIVLWFKRNKIYHR